MSSKAFFLVFLFAFSVTGRPTDPEAGPVNLNRCDSNYQQVYQAFLDEEAPKLISYPKTKSLTILGFGDSGTVYRATPSTGKKDFIVKIYSEKESLEHDFLALVFLRTRVPKTGFKIPGVKRGKFEKTLEMEDVPGISLDKLLSSEETAMDTKKRLRELYEERARILRDNIRSSADFRIQFEKSFEDFFAIEIFDNRTQSTISYLIKPSSVIVDPSTLAMSLIDPE